MNYFFYISDPSKYPPQLSPDGSSSSSLSVAPPVFTHETTDANKNVRLKVGDIFSVRRHFFTSMELSPRGVLMFFLGPEAP